MPKYIDFEEVKSSVSITTAVSMLGLEMKERNGQLRSLCPKCEKGGDRALCVTPAKEKWYCFGCQKGGDVIALAALINDTGMRDAALFLMGTASEEKKKTEGLKRSSEESFKPLEYLQPDHEAVETIGFCAEFADRVGIGYAPRGLHRGLVAIPIRDDQGTLLGYLGIDDAKLPKDFQAQ